MEYLNDRNWLQNQINIKPLRQVADELSIPYSRVFTLCKKYGISVPKRTKRRVFPHKSINQKLAIKRDYPDGRFGALHPRWRGGRRIANQSGYIYIYSPNHPKTTKARYVMEHILVAEEKLGRFLREGEIVHHINGNKKDNRPENLKVLLKKDHVREHFQAVQVVFILQKEILRLKSLLDLHNIKY